MANCLHKYHPEVLCMRFVLHFKDGTSCMLSNLENMRLEVRGNAEFITLLAEGKRNNWPIYLSQARLPDGSVRDIQRSFEDLRSVEIVL